MPIVFDEVEADVTEPGRQAAAEPQAQPAVPPGGGEDVGDALRERLLLWAQREQRLRAD